MSVISELPLFLYNYHVILCETLYEFSTRQAVFKSHNTPGINSLAWD